MTKRQIIKEPDEVKVSRPVLKTNGVSNSLFEFNIIDLSGKGKASYLEVGILMALSVRPYN
ncbi:MULTISPECIES: hypothetical protein [unclassified Nostoc]|uniref:hypothetical protein n=1 Tax=unclassified Nostoc TaxID=2593658 RepID=UPI0026289430|nr:hypothetical protein [Nostoc sp. S13]MDF5735786.1 hypothetical protein [Nostoc sp. S13]